jgi:hypothetical protein
MTLQYQNTTTNVSFHQRWIRNTGSSARELAVGGLTVLRVCLPTLEREAMRTGTRVKAAAAIPKTLV